MPLIGLGYVFDKNHSITIKPPGDGGGGGGVVLNYRP